MMTMNKPLAARRLSAALGTPISPDDLDVVYDNKLLRLTDGRCFSLAGGNAAYMGDGKWFKNGKLWNIQPHEKIRPLPEETAPA